MKINVPLGVRKGGWSMEEDQLLRQYIDKHGIGKWHQVPSRAGLNRCRKSCRLRWLNYLRPNIKRGDFKSDEIDLIIRLHKLLGNRWSLIAGRLPGRTSNDIKNYWNTQYHKNHLGERSEQCNKMRTEKMFEPKIFRPQPHTLSKKSPSMVRNIEFNTEIQLGNTSFDPSLMSSKVDPQISWWDNMLLDFDNNNENTFTFFENSTEVSVTDDWVIDEVGTSRMGVNGNFTEECHVTDWSDIFTQNFGI